MTTVEKRFADEKIVRIWSDWCSTGVWDSHGVCVPAEWLPVSDYALGLIHAMQVIYDSQDCEGVGPYADEHSGAYVDAMTKAVSQVTKELPEWRVNQR